MNTVRALLVVSLVLTGQAYGRQITGKTNAGSFGPPAAELKVRLELAFPSLGNTLNAGEQGTIKIVVTNAGGGSIEDVKIRVSSSPPLLGATLSSPADLGAIAAGMSKTTTLELRAQEDLKSQTSKITVQATATSGAKSELQSVDLVLAEKSRLVQLAVSAEFVEPSGNGLLDAGETGTVKVNIVNSGKMIARNVVTRLSKSAQIAALSITPASDLGDIASGKTKTLSFQVRASENVSSQTINLTLDVSGANCVMIDPQVVRLTTNERVIARDVTPPEIELTEPLRSSTRGMKVASETQKAATGASSMIIKGLARDSSGVAVVYVNGEEAQLRLTPAGSEFSASALLAIGRNEIEIKAVDRFKNEATLSLIVNREEPVVQGNYYALVIAVQDYQDPSVNSLQYPLQDGQNLVNTLTTYYNFESKNVTFLKNPTRSLIIQTLDQLQKKLSERDNLLIFYAGHGYWDERLKQGFWLPSNATQASRAEWISNGTIRDYVSGVTTKHTLLISDACFSGGIFKTRDAFAKDNVAIRELYKLPSRKAMTSGTLKVVPDKSVFVEYLLKRLKDNTETLMSAENLFASFRQAVINNSPNQQVPQYGEIRETGDEGGDFIFVRK